jgi:sigma-B regulation protein RsbU (phosphoserine phosphatase)
MFSTEDKLARKQLEVNALFELTRAIQHNFAESKLFQIYTFTLLGTDAIDLLALYMQEETAWQCKLSHGIDRAKLSEGIPTSILEAARTLDSSKDEIEPPFDCFDVIIPVQHKSQTLAYLFLGGIELNSDEGVNKLAFLHAFTNVLVVAIENKRFSRLQLQQESLRKELEIARTVQLNLFPRLLPDRADLSVEAFYLPHHRVGGDYYNCIELEPDRYLISVADISGKGIPASLLMSTFHASVNALIRQTNELVVIVGELNHLIADAGRGEYFITSFLCVVDFKQGILEYVNSGHNPPILYDGVTGKTTYLEKGSTILGIFNSLPVIEPEILPLSKSFLLFAFTDGLSELKNPHGVELGTELIEDKIRQIHKSGKRSVVPQIKNLMEQYRGTEPYHDDVTFLSFYYSA